MIDNNSVHRNVRRIGRSSLLLASLLSTEGYSGNDAFDIISEARGLRVPDTAEQIEWVKAFNSSS